MTIFYDFIGSFEVRYLAVHTVTLYSKIEYPRKRSEPSQEYDIPNIPGNYFFSQLNETYRETLEDYFAEQKKREQQKVRHKSLISFMPQKLFEMIDLMDRT